MIVAMRKTIVPAAQYIMMKNIVHSSGVSIQATSMRAFLLRGDDVLPGDRVLTAPALSYIPQNALKAKKGAMRTDTAATAGW
jgi:hypothetical protein